MLEKFYEDCKRFIYEAGNSSPIDENSKLDKPSYVLKEYKGNKLIRSQIVSGKELSDALGLKPESKSVKKADKVKTVEVVKEKSTVRKISSKSKKK